MEKWEGMKKGGNIAKAEEQENTKIIRITVTC